MTLADWERKNLERIERELAAADPGLARLLNAPGKWRRLRWGPKRMRLGTVCLVTMALCTVAMFLVAS